MTFLAQCDISHILPLFLFNDLLIELPSLEKASGGCESSSEESLPHNSSSILITVLSIILGSDLKLDGSVCMNG